MTFWLLVGFALGVFVPAPYDAIAISFMKTVWFTIKSWFTK